MSESNILKDDVPMSAVAFGSKVNTFVPALYVTNDGNAVYVIVTA